VGKVSLTKKRPSLLQPLRLSYWLLIGNPKSVVEVLLKLQRLKLVNACIRLLHGFELKLRNFATCGGPFQAWNWLVGGKRDWAAYQHKVQAWLDSARCLVPVE
jgi:hypothetical protein